MKKRFLVMAVCVSACMPVSALGAEIAGPAISGTAQENTDNKEETVSEEAIEKKDSGKIEDEITEVQDTVTVAADTDVLDYPGRKEGSVIGEVLEEDEISRTGTIDDIWSRILFEDDNGEEQVGYIPTSVLEGYEDKNQVASDATSDGTVEAGIIHKSTGEGVFAEAVEGVTQTGGNAGVLEGQPIMVSAEPSSTWCFPYYPLLPVQHLLRSVGKRNHIHRCDSYHEPYYCSRSNCNSLRF